jgi:predicted transposase/invertase (TIGR01784 family)
MAHYLDPKNDLTFKRGFGEHKHLCMSLINSMLPLERPIVSIEYQSGELIPELDILRNTIVDVRCIDADGRQFLVEMQLFWYESFKQRVLFNASKAYVMQLDTAKKFKLLQPVYSLNFVNEVFEKSADMKDEYFHHYKIVNINNTEKRINGLEFVFLELPKFKPQNRAEKKLHELWLRFLTEINENTEEIPQELLDDKLIREAVGYMEKAAYTKEQLAQYDKWKIDLLSAQSMIYDAETRGETNEKIKTVINSNRAGLPIETIAIITGLTSEEIRKIIETVDSYKKLIAK